MDCDGYPRIPMPLMCTAFVPGQIDAAVAGISDPNSRAIATAEALYFRGQATLAAKTARPYLDATDPALRYSACFICGYASLSLNRIADARRCLAGILDTPADEESPAIHATHILFASAASVLLHLPSPYSAEEFYPLAAHLPEGLRLFASYVMAHALYLRGEYGRLPGEVNEEVRHMAIGDDEVITCRPADLLKPELEGYRKELGDHIRQEEDVLSYALFPQVAMKFFEAREAKERAAAEPEQAAPAAAVPQAEKAEPAAPAAPAVRTLYVEDMGY